MIIWSADCSRTEMGKILVPFIDKVFRSFPFYEGSSSFDVEIDSPGLVVSSGEFESITMGLGPVVPPGYEKSSLRMGISMGAQEIVAPKKTQIEINGNVFILLCV